MELRHLRYFVAVAEEQNVTRAAARLRGSQPPLSRQIRDVEDELGVALFDHGAKAVRLTEAGRVFLTEARAALRRVEDAVQMAKAVADGQRDQRHRGSRGRPGRRAGFTASRMSGRAAIENPTATTRAVAPRGRHRVSEGGQFSGHGGLHYR